MDETSHDSSDGQFDNLQIPHSLEQIIFDLNEENLEFAIQKTINLFDTNYSYSFNLVICFLVYSAFSSQMNESNLYFKYLRNIEEKEKELKCDDKIIEIFGNYISVIKENEAYYLINEMIEQNLMNQNVIKNNNSKYFAHYKTEIENKMRNNGESYERAFVNNYEELSKNDFELHKKYIKEGHNPKEIAEIIRNDDIERLKEIMSQSNLNFNQRIEPSLYERCSYINQGDIRIVDYAAFFGSIKCFKYLKMNGCNINNSTTYAIAGGNIEIIHLCEQNHSSFNGAFEAAIKFHKNDIFHYIYDNNLETFENNYRRNSSNNIDSLAILCVKHGNYEILSFLEKQKFSVGNNIINEAARTGNIYLVKHFLQNNVTPNNILIYATEFGNFELVKYLLHTDGDDHVDKPNICLSYLKFYYNI